MMRGTVANIPVETILCKQTIEMTVTDLAKEQRPLPLQATHHCYRVIFSHLCAPQLQYPLNSVYHD